MADIQLYTNEKFGEIRTTVIDGEPWFVAVDVCRALDMGNPSQAISNLDKDEKVTLTTNEGHSGVRGGAQMLNVISEAGLYSLVLKSRKPEAKAFKRWITHDVIPSIRKHGAYLTPDTLEAALLNPDYLIKLATALKEETEKRKALEAREKENAPKVLFADSVGTSESTILVGDLAKIIRQNGVNIGRTRMFDWLRSSGYLMKDGQSKNMPTQYSMELGLMEIKERTVSTPSGTIINKTPVITGKGQLYFVNKFLATEESRQYVQE